MAGPEKCYLCRTFDCRWFEVIVLDDPPYYPEDPPPATEPNCICPTFPPQEAALVFGEHPDLDPAQPCPYFETKGA